MMLDMKSTPGKTERHQSIYGVMDTNLLCFSPLRRLRLLKAWMSMVLTWFMTSNHLYQISGQDTTVILYADPSDFILTNCQVQISHKIRLCLNGETAPA